MMKKLRRYVIFIVCFMVICSFVSCGDESSGGENNGNMTPILETTTSQQFSINLNEYIEVKGDNVEKWFNMDKAVEDFSAICLIRDNDEKEELEDIFKDLIHGSKIDMEDVKENKDGYLVKLIWNINEKLMIGLNQKYGCEIIYEDTYISLPEECFEERFYAKDIKALDTIKTAVNILISDPNSDWSIADEMVATLEELMNVGEENSILEETLKKVFDNNGKFLGESKAFSGVTTSDVYIKIINGNVIITVKSKNEYYANYQYPIGTDTLKKKKGSVYYLSFKPEQHETWQELAKLYTKETGIDVTVVTAAAGTYDTTLAHEIENKYPPTLFQINGPAGLEYWKNFCYDLSNSKIYKELTSTAYALKDGDKVYGVSYCIESYGLITNKTLLAKAGYSISDIKSFADLKKISEDITSRSSELGFSAFSSAGMDSTSDWRFKTHLSNIPIYFEYKKDGIGTTKEIRGTYLDGYRDIFDLYINNSTCLGSSLSAKTADDSRNEFLQGKAVFFQNGSWEYGNLMYTFKDEELAMIPIYIGVGDESNQGLCTGTENYWCVNKNASKEDIQATLDFLEWVVTSEKGTNFMANKLGLVIPYKNACTSNNLFVNQDIQYTASGKEPVTWNFPTMPSEEWKNGVGSALTAYAAEQTDANWEKVRKAFVEGWRMEYERR